MKLLTLLFPWLALRRVRMLLEPPYDFPREDEWGNGYDRALWEVALCLNAKDPAEAGP